MTGQELRGWTDRFHACPIEPRRWRRFEQQPSDPVLDWPIPPWEPGQKRYQEQYGDEILVHHHCDGFALWRWGQEPPPADMWIALKRPKQKNIAG